jgi:hypothetical protein
MYEVKNNNHRVIKFDGVLLAFSTSYRPGAPRWIEFSLYRTTGGTYVLSRVGETRVFHTLGCTLTERGGLRPIPRAALNEGSVPCNICHPEHAVDDEVAPELPRYWAQTSESPEGIIEGLYKYDESGSRYLTGVAERLLMEAAELDEELAEAYRVERIL